VRVSNIYLSSASAHYLIRRLDPRRCRNPFLSRPIWVDFCSHLWPCYHGSWSCRVRNHLWITWVDLAFLCDMPAYARELTDFKAFQKLGWFETQIISLSLREVDHLILFEFCGMQNAEKLIWVTDIYYVIDIQQLIILLRNNIFQRNFALTSEIYWGLSAQKFIQIRSDLKFLWHDI